MTRTPKLTPMGAGPFKVFCPGKGLRTVVLSSHEGRIRTAFRGQFLEHAFDSREEAKGFCQAALVKDPTPIFHVTRGNLIVDTILDVEYQTAKHRKSGVIWNIAVAVVIAVLAFLIIPAALPFQSRAANLWLAAGLSITYLLVLWFNSWNPVESVIIIVILAVLVVMLFTARNNARIRREQRTKSAAALVIRHLRSSDPELQGRRMVR